MRHLLRPRNQPLCGTTALHRAVQCNGPQHLTLNRSGVPMRGAKEGRGGQDGPRARMGGALSSRRACPKSLCAHAHMSSHIHTQTRARTHTHKHTHTQADRPDRCAQRDLGLHQLAGPPGLPLPPSHCQCFTPGLCTPRSPSGYGSSVHSDCTPPLCTVVPSLFLPAPRSLYSYFCQQPFRPTPPPSLPPSSTILSPSLSLAFPCLPAPLPLDPSPTRCRTLPLPHHHSLFPP